MQKLVGLNVSQNGKMGDKNDSAKMLNITFLVSITGLLYRLLFGAEMIAIQPPSSQFRLKPTNQVVVVRHPATETGPIGPLLPPLDESLLPSGP